MIDFLRRPDIPELNIEEIFFCMEKGYFKVCGQIKRKNSGNL